MRSPGYGRTVPVVTTPPFDAAHRSPDQSVVRAVRRLLVEPEPDLRLESIVATLDIEVALLDAAMAVLQRIQVLGQRCHNPRRRPLLIAGITDLAASYGVASPAAIGAIGMLADQLRQPDETLLAQLLTAARHDVGDLDLLAGAVALLAASTTYLADVIGEPPVSVHDELHRVRRGRPSARCREHVGQHAPLRRR